ncbi:MAG TPA: hypothetical protein VEJ63_12715 [Planctomycetota bacterium]|nr:hypothetical protein [Planctomycetota bacterium]
MVTTPWVLVEVADAFSAVESRAVCDFFIRRLQANRHLEIVHCTDLLFQSGLNLYRDRPDKEWSLTDCISFVVMKQKRLTHALTGDITSNRLDSWRFSSE